MTQLEKKRIFDREYAKSLEWHKNEYSNYESYLRIPLKERWEILEHFKCIFEIMKKCGVCRFEGEEPMSNVTDFLLKIKTKGDPNSLGDILISNHDSCWTDVMFEQTTEEIEAAARRNAQMEVETAKWKEKRDAEEAEKRRKEEEEEEWKARNKEEEEWRAKCKKDMDDWKARQNSKKEKLEAWYDNVKTELDKIRCEKMYWYADENLENNELKAVKKYARTLFAFTDAQNMGCTGLELYSQNAARANAHADMLDAFGLGDNEYALHVTRSYDFSDDYDPRTEQYKHLNKEIVVNMLGYACKMAQTAPDIFH